jgi:hypothetical protein
MKIYVLISLLTAVVASLATEKAMNGTRGKKNRTLTNAAPLSLCQFIGYSPSIKAPTFHDSHGLKTFWQRIANIALPNQIPLGIQKKMRCL